MFVAAVSAIATQCVCGRACRGVRDRKLARERRRGDRDGARADERGRQRASPKPTPSLTTPDYGPGEMSESDWSPYEIQFTTGKTAVIKALSSSVKSDAKRS